MTGHRDAPAPASAGDGAGDRPREGRVVCVAARGPGHVRGARSLTYRPAPCAPRVRVGHERPQSQRLGYAELGEVFSSDLRGMPRRDLHKHLPQLGEWNLRKR